MTTTREFFDRHVLSGQSKSLVQTCFIGSTVANMDMLRDLIESVSCETVWLCSPHAFVLDELQNMSFPGKTIRVQLLTGSYPSRGNFLQSRAIAINRIAEHEAAFSHTYRLKCDPEIYFQKLATRRLSISMVYSELTVLNDFMRYIPADPATRGVFLAYAISDADLIDCFPGHPAINNVSVCPVPIQVPRISDKARMKAYRYQDYRHLSALLKRPSRFLKYHINYQKVRLKPLLLKAWFDVKSWRKASVRKLSSQPYDVLIFIHSLDQYKIQYYWVLYNPILQRLLADGKHIKLITHQDDKDVFDRFVDRFRRADGTLHPRFHVEQYTNAALSGFIQMNNLQFFHTMDLETWNQMSFPLRERIGHAQSAFNRIQNLISVMNHVLLNNQFSVLLGKEEDGDCMTMLKSLAPMHNRSFESIVIPSCLPEYSEVYDMMDIDHFCMHHDFVKKLFMDQNLNAQHTYVVGSTEWEEAIPADQKLPDDVNTLIADSDLVLGIFHQPLFTQYHQQAIYDGLVVDFPEVYRRFLEAHPKGCILIKLHRSDTLADVQAYLPPSDRIKILDFTTSNQLLYKTFDVALAIHSTTLMHSIAHGLPAICLYKYPDYTHYYDFIESMGCLATNSPDEVLAWIHRFKNDAPFRGQILRKVTAYHHQVQRNPASEQILSIINHTYEPPESPAANPSETVYVESIFT